MKVKRDVQLCKRCHTITESGATNGGLCSVCRNPKRKQNVIAVVEKISDLESIERVGAFDGTYHIVGKLFPIKKGETKKPPAAVKSLMARIQKLNKKDTEVVLALNPTPDGTLATLYLKELLAPLGITITQIGRGIPTGGELEYTDKETLEQAITRRSIL